MSQPQSLERPPEAVDYVAEVVAHLNLAGDALHEAALFLCWDNRLKASCIELGLEVANILYTLDPQSFPIEE